MRREAVCRASGIRGAIVLPAPMPVMGGWIHLKIVGIMKGLLMIPIRWAAMRPTATICMTWRAMFVNGITTGIPVRIISTAWTTVSSTILRDQILVLPVFCAAAPVMTPLTSCVRPIVLGSTRPLGTTTLGSVVHGTDPPPLFELRWTGYPLVLLFFYSSFDRIYPKLRRKAQDKFGVLGGAPSKIFFLGLK